MDRRRITARVKVAERPAQTVVLTAGLGLLSLLVIVLLIVPH